VLFYAIGGTYLVLALGSICQGLAWALFSGNNSALLYDTLATTGQQEDYQEHLGRTTSLDHVGIALGSIIGGALAAISFSLVMWLSVLPQVINLLISLCFVEPELHSQPVGNPYAHLRSAIRLLVTSRDLRLLSIASILGEAIGESGYQLRAAFIQHLWPLWALGVARTMENALAAVGFFFSGRLIKRFSEFGLLIGGGIIGWIVDMVSIAIPTRLSPALMALMSVFHGTGIVSQDSLFQQRFTNEQRATLGSLVALGGSIMFGLVSLVSGALADWFGVVHALLILKSLSILPLWFIWRVYRQHQSLPDATIPVSDHLTDHVHAK
jgi:MFS family permease